MQTKFQILDSFLIDHQAYWRHDPFYLCQTGSVPWAELNSGLRCWLSSLTNEDVSAYKEDPEQLLLQLSHYFPSLKNVIEVIDLPCSALDGLKLERNTCNGIPGRKLEQILAMGEIALSNHHGDEWLEWCSGKGFLGRVLAQQSNHKVTSFEWQQSLCDSGQDIANTQQLDMTFIQGDAFSESATNVFKPSQHAVALHACGDLHVRLLEHGVNHQLPAITISPCCYHLIQHESYQSLSHLGQSSLLALTKSDLRIPLQETVTGGERVKRHRQLEMTFRLGFSELLKRELNLDHYVPVPSIKKSQLDDGFTSFCQWAANKKEISLPSVQFDDYLQLGESMFWEMERLSLVQQAFRRPLEIWLALDKAMYLQQHGYKVSISEFCDKKITPRNILIHAQL